MKQRNRPGGYTEAAPTTSTVDAAESNGQHRRQDGYAAPTAEDRGDAELLAWAAVLGYRLTVRCLDCGNWLAHPVSVAAHRGPRCRARMNGAAR